ncbi:hypothetical protein CsSME_00023896 [Camellia sinensis var. sinensis]
MGEWYAAQLYLLGTQPPLVRAGFVRYSWFESHFRIQPTLAKEAQMTPEEVDQYARGFIMFLFGTTLFADRANNVPLCLLSALVDVRRIRRYDWGGAGLATLYGYMSSSSRRSGQLLGGYWRAWELWVYAYFPRLALVPDVENPLGVPFSHRFDITNCISFSDHLAALGSVASSGEGSLRGRRGGCPLSDSVGGPGLSGLVPGDYTVGWGAKHHRGEGDYTEYVRTYIMRPLSGGRRAERERPAAPAAGAGAGTSRMARIRGRSGPRRGQGVSWPALPTVLTCRGQGEGTYQIPFAPPPADHELVGFYDLPPPRTFDVLALYSIPPPFQIPPVGGVPAGPSIPARGGRGDAVRPRTRAGRVHVRSSSRAPSPDDDNDDDDESETEAEAESSEEAGDDSDSGSDSDADDDAPGPSSRKKVRTDPWARDY